jgi:hypothetical protein
MVGNKLPEYCYAEREDHRFSEKPKESDIVPPVASEHFAHEQRANDAQLNAERFPQRSGLRFARTKVEA